MDRFSQKIALFGGSVLAAENGAEYASLCARFGAPDKQGTMAYQILSRHDENGAAGESVRVKFDALCSHDITYDSAQGGFIIPITSLEVAYTPEIYEIEKKANSIILSVGYIGAKAWAEIDGGEYVSPQPDKFMKITLRQGENGYYIASLQSVNAQEVANAPTAAATVVSAIPSNIADENIIAELTEATTQNEDETDEDTTGETDESEEDETGEETTTAA